MHEAARALESACREEASPERVSELLERVDEALSPLIEQLVRLDDSRQPVASTPRVVTHEDLQPMLERLREHLEAFDADAIEVAEGLCERLRGTPHETAANRLEKLVESFDFEQALSALGNLADGLAPAPD